MTGRPVRGMVLEVNLDTALGHEQGRSRPCACIYPQLRMCAFFAVIVAFLEPEGRNTPFPKSGKPGVFTGYFVSV